jgi:hypothetical protein
MPFRTFDAWDQAALTKEITRPPDGRDPGAAEDSPSLLGATLAPERNVAGRSDKLRVRELVPYGKGQFRAPSASPALIDFGAQWVEKIIGLALPDEIHPIEEEAWLRLNSSDENVRRSEGLELIDRGRQLHQRYVRLLEYMRWQMLLNGRLTVSYPNSASLEIDYQFVTGHKPTMSVLWSSTTTADPVADVQTLSELMADDSGFYARYIHMNSKTFDYLVRNTKIINTINFFAGGANTIQRPRRQDILELFSSFNQSQSVVIYDNGFRDAGTDPEAIGRTSLTKYLPDGKVLLMGPYSIDGTNVAETLIGQVLVSTGYNSTDIRQGYQNEIVVDPLSHTHYLRSAGCALPRLNYPEVVIAATVAS